MIEADWVKLPTGAGKPSVGLVGLTASVLTRSLVSGAKLCDETNRSGVICWET